MIARSGTTENAFTYTGEQWDPNAGFYYLRARWMDPSSGRFIGVDPYEGDPQSPVSLHRYLYANSSPINFCDPTGEFSFAEINVTQIIQSTLRTIENTVKGVSYRGFVYEAKNVIRGSYNILKVADLKRMRAIGQLERWRIPGTKYEIHHLLEQRLWSTNSKFRQFFSKVDDIPGVDLEDGFHQLITKRWAEALPRAARGMPRPSYSIEQIMQAAGEVYRDQPILLQKTIEILLQLI